MKLFDYETDAQRVYDVLADGGIGIIPTDVGYVILAIAKDAIWRIFEAKERKPEKLNAMIGCAALHEELHDLGDDRRAVIAAITGSYDLPLVAVGPAQLDHPKLARLEPDILDQSTHEGTVAMLMNAGPLLDTMAQISHRNARPVIGSSANLSLRGVKFRVEDIEPQIIDAADIVIDYGLMRWGAYAKSSTMIDFTDYSVVRHGSCFDLIADICQRHFDIALAPPPDGA